MKLPKHIDDRYRTSTVLSLCQSMREVGEYSALPILADALQDAGYDDIETLDRLRGNLKTVEAEALTACIFSEETYRSVEWLVDYCGGDCPEYETTMIAACGKQEENEDDEYYEGNYKVDEYLHFSGRDAHGEIHPDFWDHVEIVIGKKIDPMDKPTHFSCSC